MKVSVLFCFLLIAVPELVLALRIKNGFANRLAQCLPIAIGCFLNAPIISNAAVDDPSAIARYKDAERELQELDTNWDKVASAGGDSIRRKLGTVYSPPKCSSALCSFNIFTDKFVRAHSEDLNLAEFDAPSAELLEALNQADFLAYSSVFSDYGNGGGGVDYINNSRLQVKRAKEAITKVISVIEELN